MNLHHLEWDTCFFGYKVALIDDKSNTSLTDLIPILKKEDYSLAYLFIAPSHRDLNLEATANAGSCVDTRIVFSQYLDCEHDFPHGLEVYDATSAEPELEELAIRSGIFSRFAIDPKIGAGKFQELYSLWLKRSLSKEIASETIVCRKEKKIVGFVTLSTDMDTRKAKIGLIAVAHGMEGLGIGTKLIIAAQHISWKNKCTQLDVVTQKRNEAAMRLYSKNGFKIKEELNTYHFWF